MREEFMEVTLWTTIYLGFFAHPPKRGMGKETHIEDIAKFTNMDITEVRHILGQ
ncbi:hypothetical protein [Bacillus toyonensis]|uniref:hypothetical protein n=1 Tax=Bacillus toyonensis TaxID=155322 RepID=UPI0015D46F8A|nr:hypothetical protein [Bacillus toyonensis]